VSDTLAFTVRWDNAVPAPGGGKLKWYDVQWLDEVEGVWHDWQEQTMATSASFSGQRGHTYRFRARAWQRYPNGAHLYGPYRPGGDTTTRVAGPRLDGRVLNHAGNPVTGATVAISGTSYATTSGPDGRYTLEVLPWPEPHTAVVSHAWWTAPEPRHGLTFGLTETVPFTWTLLPPDDGVANGEFEADLDGWTAGSAGGGAPAVVAEPVHTGYKALALGGLPTAVAGPEAAERFTAGVTQTVALNGAWQPVLSLWYRPAAGSPAAVFNVTLTTLAGASGDAPALSETEVLTPSLGVSGWQHLSHSLGVPGATFTGTVTVGLRVQGEAGAVDAAVYLDEVGLGSGPGGPHRVLLPLARRGASGR
jgi:hypothetical protein